MIALICCYWIYDQNHREKIEMEGLNEYIEQIVDYFDKNKDFTDIILCWWYTNPEVNISESESMKIVLFEKFKEKNIDINIKTENSSFITYENFVFWTLSVRNKDISKILIIADIYRETKVRIESSVLFNWTWIELFYKFFNRKDTHIWSNNEIQSFKILPQDLESKKFIKLKKFFQETLKK